jgi:hypothetical protein
MKPLIDQKIYLFLKKSKRPILAVTVWNNDEIFEASYGKEKELSIDVLSSVRMERLSLLLC